MKRTSHINFAFLVMLLLAVFVRSMIPVGFMASSNTAIPITICSGLTTKTIFVHGEAPTSQNEKTDHFSSCPFAPPVLAEITPHFDVTGYISIAYAKFHPDNRISVNLTKEFLKPFFSQGPPVNFAA